MKRSSTFLAEIYLSFRGSDVDRYATGRIEQFFTSQLFLTEQADGGGAGEVAGGGGEDGGLAQLFLE